MGSTASLIPLEPLTGVDQGDEADVRRAVWGVLVAQWNEAFGGEPVTQTVIDWLDDTLTLELQAEREGGSARIALDYDLGVDWPMDLADHWVSVAFAVGRVELDDALASVGWRLAQHRRATPLPSFESEIRSPQKRRVYFEHEGAICSADSEDLFRHVRIDGESIAESYSALASLDVSERERVLEKAAGGRCECPPCETARSDFLRSDREGGPAHVVEIVHQWPWIWPWRWVPSRDGNGLWISGEEKPRIYAGWNDGLRVERCDLPRIATDALATVVTEIDGAPAFLVVIGGGWHRSLDGGAHWEELRETPPGACRGVVARASSPASLLAWARETTTSANEDSVFASHDGGRTWRRLARAPRIDRLSFGPGDRVYGIFGDARDGVDAVVVTSTDGGATFSGCAPLPFVAEDILVGRDGRTLQIFGTRFEGGTAKSGRLARSIDAGGSWTIEPEPDPERATHRHRAAVAHPSGRWFHVPASSEWLQYSDDEGATWNLAARVQPDWLAVDPTRDRAIFAGDEERMLRISWPHASS